METNGLTQLRAPTYFWFYSIAGFSIFNLLAVVKNSSVEHWLCGLYPIFFDAFGARNQEKR